MYIYIMDAKTLKLKIDERGVKQRWIANKLKVSDTLVSQWISGDRNIKPVYQLELIKLLN